METTKYNFPALWASYLINGDSSGMDEYDISDCEIETMDLGTCINASEKQFVGRFKGLVCDLLEYTFKNPE